MNAVGVEDEKEFSGNVFNGSASKSILLSSSFRFS